MTTARWSGIANQIRLYAIWMLLSSVWFGGDLADAAWKRHDAFYPFPLLASGLCVVLWSFATARSLNQLSYAVKLEEAQTMKSAARRLAAYVFCGALVWLFVAVCAMAAKLFGWHYVAWAIGLGIPAIGMILTTEREIRRLPQQFFTSRV